ncbi:MAG: RHS repeat-associated core domain-containing protein [Flavobacterium sp.]|nr:RHS repeat-associated core domain-containing protein [Candidatus Neoflavobacterium equi]
MDNMYKFNAKELDQSTGLYYYGARYEVYTALVEVILKISVWLSVDPLAEQMPSWSPYNYAFNNPIKFIDPDGREPIKPYVGTVGNFVSLLNNSSRKVGAFKGAQASSYLSSLSNTKFDWKQGRPLPTQTGYFNMKKG